MSKQQNERSPMDMSELLSDLPQFMRSPYPNVNFNSAFPPFTTKVRVRGVMERAGFDVYKPEKDPNRHKSKQDHLSGNRLVSEGVLSSPNPLYSGKGRSNHSDPSLRFGGTNKRNYSSPVMGHSSHSNPNLRRLNDASYSTTVESSRSDRGVPVSSKMSARSDSCQNTPRTSSSSSSHHKSSSSSHNKSLSSSNNNKSSASSLQQRSLQPSQAERRNIATEDSHISNGRQPLPPSSLSSSFLAVSSPPTRRPPSAAQTKIPQIPSPSGSSDGMNASYEFPRKASPLHGPQPFADETDDDDRNAAGQPGRPQSDSSLRFQSPSIPAKDIDLRSGGVKEKKVISPFNDDDNDEDDDESDDGDSSIDAFDAKFENRGQTIPQLSGDDSVDQLLTMRNQMTGASAGSKVPEIRVGDEGPSAGSMGQESSIYGNQGIKRLSTMQTNDLKIYNLPDSDTDDADDRSIERGKFDMSTIQEVTEMDDSHADLSPSSPGTTPSLNSPSNEFDVPGLTKVKLNSLESPVQADRRGDSEDLMGAPSDSIHRHSLSHSSVSSKNSVVKAVFNGSESSDDSSPSATRKSESLDSTIDGASMARPLKAEQQKPKVRANLKSSSHGQDAKNAADKEERDEEEKEEEEVKYPPGKGPCRKCHKPILPGQKSIWSKDNQLSGQWHRRCFSCYACSTKFSKGQSCYVYNDRPYCETHFHELNGSLCRICGKGVEGECLQNEVNEVFHMDCLKCSYCGVPIRTDYFIYNGQVMCENDAKEQMMLMREGNNGAESDKVVKRRTRMMYV